jgi:hypothetical protein
MAVEYMITVSLVVKVSFVIHIDRVNGRASQLSQFRLIGLGAELISATQNHKLRTQSLSDTNPQHFET